MKYYTIELKVNLDLLKEVHKKYIEYIFLLRKNIRYNKPLLSLTHTSNNINSLEN